MTQIKICGLYREADIDYVNAANPEYAGFIINYPKSHRSISPNEAGKLRRMLNSKTKAVGVFVDQPMQLLISMIEQTGIDMVQLHGSEDESYIRELKRKISIPIIQSFQISSYEMLETAKESMADFILLDSGQGTGEHFDWSMIDNMERPFFLAGGLTAHNLTEAINTLHPMVVDISSGVETEKRKDLFKIRQVVEIAHLAKDK